MATITKALIGTEDLSLKTSGTTRQTFTRTDSAGRTLTVNQIDGADIQFRSLAKTLDDLVDGGGDVPINVTTITCTAITCSSVTSSGGISCTTLAASGAITGSSTIQGTTITATTALSSNTVSERVAGSGVTIDGVKNKDNEIILDNNKSVKGKTTAAAERTLVYVTSGDAASFGDTNLASIIRASSHNVTVWDGSTSKDIWHDGNAPPTDVWPSFRAYLLAQQNNITGTDKVEFDTENFDTNSDYDNVTNFRFTPTAAGKYLLTASIQWTATTAGDLLSVFIYKNGFVVASNRIIAGSTTLEGTTVTTIEDANGTTDYFEVFAANNNRDTSDILNESYQSFFAGSRIAK